MRLEGQWVPRGGFAAPFGEPFHVAAADGAYFLVTDSGAVFRAEEKDGKWQAAAAWNDPSRPIIAMLTRAEDPGAWVFGKDFYFNLARQITPKPCRDVTKGDQKLGEPTRTAYECARVLHEKGELENRRAER